MWSELYSIDNKPTLEGINDFVNSELWKEFCIFLEDNYTVLPRIEYSKCSIQKGWNVKYKKASKSLCTLYPMKGYFIILIVIGEKEQIESELIMPTCTVYVQQLFLETASALGGKWLMIEVRDRDVLEDVLKLIRIRVNKK
ncbi:MAG: DUF3788 domain-containing protein [Clostridia bacterium]|nr:DUF3788 domain-containing protein [Clostridia bacterium]